MNTVVVSIQVYIRAFVSISESTEDYPPWLSEGKTRLRPKSGEFTSENQRPITCLNNMYKWFTSCLQNPTVDSHLTENELMKNEQRGAKAKCSGMSDYLMIDRMVIRWIAIEGTVGSREELLWHCRSYMVSWKFGCASLPLLAVQSNKVTTKELEHQDHC